MRTYETVKAEYDRVTALLELADAVDDEQLANELYREQVKLNTELRKTVKTDNRSDFARFESAALGEW